MSELITRLYVSYDCHCCWIGMTDFSEISPNSWPNQFVKAVPDIKVIYGGSVIHDKYKFYNFNEKNVPLGFGYIPLNDSLGCCNEGKCEETDSFFWIIGNEEQLQKFEKWRISNIQNNAYFEISEWNETQNIENSLFAQIYGYKDKLPNPEITVSKERFDEIKEYNDINRITEIKNDHL